jgi:Holliday junction resolvase
MLLKTPDDQARALQNIFNELGFDIDPELVQKRLLELHKGLVQEDEFIYILNWLKNVSLVHKLDQFHIPPDSKLDFTIPDIFIIAKTEEGTKPLYIEIKTSKDHSLSWTEKYYNGFKNYSDITGIPLLIAWKWNRFETWTIFKLEDFKQKVLGGNYKIDLETAHKRNLISTLFEDYLIALPDNVALVIKHEKIKMHPIPEGEQWETVIQEVYWLDRHGNQADFKNNGIMALFFILPLEEIVEQDEHFIYYKWIPSPNKSLYAQSVPIRLAEVFSETPVNWLKKIRNQEFQVSYNGFLADLTQAIEEGTLQNIFFIKPNYE